MSRCIGRRTAWSRSRRCSTASASCTALLGIDGAYHAEGDSTADATTDTGAGHDSAATGDTALPGDAGNDSSFPSDPGPVGEVTAGRFHTCLRFQSGVAMCWGRDDDFGELGNGTMVSTSIPEPAMGSGIVKLVAGAHDTCGLLADGAVCAGKGGLGELLDDVGDADSPVPVATSALPALPIAIASGDEFTCAVVQGGDVYCAGNGASGVLGNGSTGVSLAPVKVDLQGKKATAIAAIDIHACALLTDGTVSCWGDDSYGQLGAGKTTPDAGSATPVAVQGLPGAASAICVGDAFSCAIVGNDENAAVWCWGDNTYGQLGNGDPTVPQSAVALQVKELDRRGIAVVRFRPRVLRERLLERRHLVLGQGRLGAAGQRRYEQRILPRVGHRHQRVPAEPRRRGLSHVRDSLEPQRALLGRERLRPARQRLAGCVAEPRAGGRGAVRSRPLHPRRWARPRWCRRWRTRKGVRRRRSSTSASPRWRAAAIATGCPALAESYRLDPRPGVLFTLAECENKWGKLASALTHYEAYLDLFARMRDEEKAHQRGRDRVAAAQRERCAADVPQLAIALPARRPRDHGDARRGCLSVRRPSASPFRSTPASTSIVARTPDGVSHEMRVTARARPNTAPSSSTSPRPGPRPRPRSRPRPAPRPTPRTPVRHPPSRLARRRHRPRRSGRRRHSRAPSSSPTSPPSHSSCHADGSCSAARSRRRVASRAPSGS